MDFESLFQVLPKDPIKWNIQDVGKWLQFIGLGQYHEQFQEFFIDGACLSHISEEDLVKDLGINSGIIRKKILNWLNIGIKNYSVFLKDQFKGKMEIEHISLSDMPFNVFIKQSLENEFQAQKDTNLAQILMENQENIQEMKNLEFQEQNLKTLQNTHQQFSSKILQSNQNITNIQQQQQPQFPLKTQQSIQNHLKRNSSSSNSTPSNIYNNNNNQNQHWQFQQAAEQQQMINENNNEFEKLKNENDLDQQSVNELIIQPNEGPQTNFYCIDENGGKIGRHSSSQILILEESISRKHAEIVFQSGDFHLIDIGSTTGTFIKIIDQLILKTEMILEMGSNQFLITNIKNIDNKKGELEMVIIEGPNIDSTYILTFDERENPYNIGRKSNNEISLPDDHHLSNIHTRIYYIDGQFILEDQSSTNGSWQRLSKENEMSIPFLLKDKTIFKIGTTSTYICLKRNKKIQNVERANENSCVICYESDRDALYLPCKHNTACVKCSKNLKVCPICRTQISDFIKIYKA